jgi:hypothetical protein
VGFAAFVVVGIKLPDATALGWSVLVGVPVVSSGLITIGLLTRKV